MATVRLLVPVVAALALTACRQAAPPPDAGAEPAPTPSATVDPAPSEEAHFVDPDCRFDLLHIEASIRDYNDAGRELRASQGEDADYVRYFRRLQRLEERLGSTEVSVDVEQARDSLAAIYGTIGDAYRDAAAASSSATYEKASARIDTSVARLDTIFGWLFVRRGYRCGDSEP